MIRNISVFLLACVLGVSLDCQQDARSAPIQDLSGLVAIFICFEAGPGSLDCTGPTRAQLIATPNTAISVSTAGIGGVSIHAGLSGANGDLGAGDDHLVVALTGPNPATFLLESVFLGLDDNLGFQKVFASSITATAGVGFATGYSPSDLPRALGPSDSTSVGLTGGTIVFGFDIKTDVVLVSEPETLYFIYVLFLITINIARSRKIR
jgi:hypothetical protein